MLSSEMFRSARTYVSDERSASINSVTRIGDLGTKLVVTSNRCILRYAPQKRRFI
jgi:hypothetical protein